MPPDTLSTPPADARPMVFFDGGCSLCSREIAHYRRLDRAGRVQWVDIVREPHLLERHGLDYASAMAVFHVKDGVGHMHRGVWGFVELWRHLPYYKALASVTQALRLTGPLDRIYGPFARWRLGRRDRSCPVDRDAGT
ncbi:MAG: DUF393 domain-containing protein [Gammaproteobacteria bacterium]|nr:DUF393 domain-containing protein [Gammaproteobacteria bacterium]